MAFGKKLPTQFGVDATYWKISGVVEDYIVGQAKVVLAGYISAEARAAGLKPLEAREVTIAGDAYTPDSNRAEIYAKIKTATEWADAQDL